MGTRRQTEGVLPLLKRHEVQVLRRAGFSQSDVAQRAGVSVREVRRIDAETEVAHVDDAAERQRRGIGRPSKAEPHRELVARLLAEDGEMMTLEVLRRVKASGYTGSKSAMYALVAEMRPPRPKPIVRFEGLAGEFSQHDFGHVDVRFVDGRRKRVHFFASRLKYSRWVQVSIVENEQVESLLRSLVDHFTAMGGVPLMAVFDRPKTIVLRSNPDGSVAEWNSTFAQAMLELGVGVELCFPRSGNQKGSVERLVGWVKNSFFKPRRFLDERDLAEQLAAWHIEANTRTPSRATGLTPSARIAEERTRFRPLKVTPNEFALRIPVVVGPTAEVLYEGVPYSMPPPTIHLPATLMLYRDRVRIIAGRHTSEQRRRRRDEPKETPPEHRAEMLAAVHGARARRYYKREQILALGKVAEAFLTELVHRRPRTWWKDVDALFELLQERGDDAMRAALEHAVGANRIGSEYVAHDLAGSAGSPPGVWSWNGVSKAVANAQRPARGAKTTQPSGRGRRAHPRGGAS